MRIEEFDPAADDGKVDACYQMYVAGLPFDDPDGPPMSEHLFSAWMRQGWSGERRETALAADVGGARAGGYLLELPDRKQHAHGRADRHGRRPARRRQGYGAALLRHAAERAAAHDRTLLSAQTRCGSPGSAFASAMGARAGVVEVRRVLELAGIPDGKLAGLRGTAEAAARGYSLLCWTGRTPEEHLDEVAQGVGRDGRRAAQPGGGASTARISSGSGIPSAAPRRSASAATPWPPGTTGPASWPA